MNKNKEQPSIPLTQEVWEKLAASFPDMQKPNGPDILVIPDEDSYQRQSHFPQGEK